MKAGDIVEADVVGVEDNGIYLVVDGRKGFINATHITWVRFGVDPREYARVGQTLHVQVYAVTADGFYASLKALDPQGDPYAPELYRTRPRRRGVVDSRASYGVFVKLDTGAIGRLAIDDHSVTLEPGDEVDVEVMSCDPDTAKLELSLARDSGR